MGFIIYLVKNIINNKVYIGQTIRTLNNRICTHKYAARLYADGKVSYSSHLYAAVNKYGWENFEFIIIAECKNLDDLNFI